jgi:hypothetical protein
VTVSLNIDNVTKRYRRNTLETCYKFKEGDPIKNEFYSPGYPESYPNNISCFKVLKGEILVY